LSYPEILKLKADRDQAVRLPGVQKKHIQKGKGGSTNDQSDMIVVEEPLEMQIAYGPLEVRTRKTLSITMRTPGQDANLFAGFLLTEGIIKHAEDILSITHVGQKFEYNDSKNVILAKLRPNLDFDLTHLSRNFYTTSSCGVCGKTSIDLVETAACHTTIPNYPIVDPQLMCALPDVLRQAQILFKYTGGIHAAGLFTPEGKLILVREDVGRHNALDKLIGAAMLKGMLPLSKSILLLSGRISFELVQKAAMAGIPIVGAVGAPSSLAIELAEQRGMTLVGFIRPNGYNIYCNQNRFTLKENVTYEV